MRLLPQSLFGRLVVVLVAGLLLAQVASLALHLQDRGRVLRDAVGWQSAQRIATLVELLEALPPRQRERVAAAFRNPLLRVRLSPRPLSPPRPEGGRPPAAVALLRTLLARRLGAGRPLRVEVLEGPGEALAAMPMPMPPGMAMPPAMQRRMGRMMGFGWPRPVALRIETQLRDGTWVRFEHRVPREFFGRPLRLLASIAVLLVSVVAIALLVVRRVTRPLATLAAAAEALGRDIGAPPLPESGPLEVRRAARAFNTMQRRIARLVEERSRVLAAVSHDLKTPLTRMRLRAELIEEPATRERLVADIGEMEQMVNAALAFARGTDSREAPATVDLGALLESIAEDAGAAGNRLRVSGAEGVTCEARPLALKRCLSNLVDNALRYAGGEAEVEVEVEPERVRIAVLDRGPGIPAAEIERVFEPFYRLEPSRSRDSGGTGLGLSIARNVARAHGGDLVLRPRPGGGLIAELTLAR